ncbi:MAG: 23S rRNA (adenine(2030)-N(6))-methyltransferase RlmJ [Gammaproteobacteria bacterium]
MLSYRHGFHAGSFVDVHKHITLILLLQSLLKKDSPFCYLETHAGSAHYDLRSVFAQKNREYETGISRLWEVEKPPAAVADYLATVRKVNAARRGRQTSLRYYPGSPAIARQFLRPRDRMVLMELHNTEIGFLKKYFSGDRQAQIHHRDGFEGLPGLVPPAEKRGLVLIDPAYEAGNEYERLLSMLKAAWKKWPTGIYAVWYPLQHRQPVPRFLYELRTSGIGNIFLHEFRVIPDVAVNRLSGTGMIIINPPWQFDVKIKKLLEWLALQLDRGSGMPPRCEWLV